jgi:hypothetical protein
MSLNIRQFLKRKAAKAARKNSLALGSFRKVPPPFDFAYNDVWDCGGGTTHQQMTQQGKKKLFRQRDRDRKVAFLTQCIPADLSEVIDIDLSVLEEPMEKFA